MKHCTLMVLSFGLVQVNLATHGDLDEPDPVFTKSRVVTSAFK